MDHQTIAREIFLAAVEKVKPDRLIRENVKRVGDFIEIAGKKFPLLPEGKLVVTGAGKATALMAQELEKILVGSIDRGHIVVKYGHTALLKQISCTEGGHPVPDENCFLGTQKVIQTVAGLTEKDIHICLLSGGGSALLSDVMAGITREELQMITGLLLKSGADIREMNAVRKHLSGIKGGQLARMAYPATTISLILSDVINDPLDVIASGPTAPDPSTFQEVWKILEKYHILEKIPDSIRQLFEKGKQGFLPETPKQDDRVFQNVHNIIIGNNRIALSEAASYALLKGFRTKIVTSNMEGDCNSACDFIMGFINKLGFDKPNCLLFGGETTVVVKGNGKGGRNQHLALLLAKALHEDPPKGKTTILCAGTDGTDGPTDATGAIINGFTWQKAVENSVKIQEYIDNNDSYHFFKTIGGQIVTGPTMTNVMDVVIVLTEGN